MTTVHHAAEVEPRFGDWGPGYLLNGPDAAYGIVTLRPGDAFANHLHVTHEETFFVFDGSIEMWLDRTERVVLRPGDLLRCTAGIEHFLRNVSSEPARALFIKAPGVEGDKVDLPWTPDA